MADEDYGDGDASYFFDDDDYLYVEDDYAVADELAETQVPSPGYTGTNAEVDLESYEYDIYEYFGELEYGQDEYWDTSLSHLSSPQNPSGGDKSSGGKRKRDDAKAPRTAKQRKVSPHSSAQGGEEGEEGENVVFRPFGARVPPLPPVPREGKGFALLPDWKDKFPQNAGGTPTKKAMPADMKRAAEAKGEEDTPTKVQNTTAAIAEAEEEEGWEDEDEDEEEGGDEDVHDALAGLNPDTLRTILRQKLDETGLDKMDEGAFEQAIAKMLSGSSDDAARDLANLMLGQASEGGDQAVSGWLSGQGVQLEAEDDEAADEPTETSGFAGVAQTSPSDSAVGEGRRTRAGKGKTVAFSQDEAADAQRGEVTSRKSQSADGAAEAVPSAKAGKKRKAESTGDTEEAQPAKRRQGASAMPPPEAAASGPASRAGRRTRSAAAKSGNE